MEENQTATYFLRSRLSAYSKKIPSIQNLNETTARV
jgi:hypothetical protein